MGPAKPTNYKITLEPDLENFKFTGKETIQVKLEKPLNKIVLNSVALKITDCLANYNGKISRPKIKLDKKREELTLSFSEKIKNRMEISLSFEGTLSDQLVGFYRSKYFLDGKEKYLATTQFEATDARRAFPCFDHPEMKATFDVSLIIGKNLTAISNTPVIERKEIDKGRKIVWFAQTPMMSTYLLYFGVGEFEFVEDEVDKIIIRVATTPSKKNQGLLALDFAKKFLKFYQDYFQIKYPLPKLDLIALPDFASGAMENWGAITFREAALLYNPKTSSTATKQNIAEIISHEIAHQWFGNLVTMCWWNDLWLNESFATFIATKVVDHFYPTWDLWSQFLNSDTAAALELDALKNSHPIEVKVKTPAEIGEIFDEISYQKGGSVLRMLESYLGEKTFQKGLQYYLTTHKFGNATTDDLWAALEKVSAKPIKKMMNQWIGQTGYPLVSTEQKNSALLLSQKRFLLERTRKEKKSSWLIPVSIKSEQKNISRLMAEKKEEIKLDQHPRWFKINFGQSGFYRVKYSPTVLNNLKELIRNKNLPNVDRW